MSAPSKSEWYQWGYYKGLAPEPRFHDVLKIFKGIRARKILDVGCGDGSFSQLLKNTVNAEEVYGLEISEEAVHLAIQKGVRAIHADVETAFPFNDEYFDAIYMGEILEHVFDPEHLLHEACRVLVRGGICVVTTPNMAGWPNRLALLFGYQPFPTAASPRHENAGKLMVSLPQGQWGHIRVMTLRALKELMSYNGFKILSVHGSVATVKGANLATRLSTSLEAVMRHFPSMATRVIVVATKS